MIELSKLISELNTFEKKGKFIFGQTDHLSNICNIPAVNNYSGVYLFYNNETNELIYIGISGREKDGKIVHRKDGLRGRFLKGKQFGSLRKDSIPNQMKLENINNLRIEWFVTCGHNEKIIPRHLEINLLNAFFIQYKRLPKWNKQI